MFNNTSGRGGEERNPLLQNPGLEWNFKPGGKTDKMLPNCADKFCSIPFSLPAYKQTFILSSSNFCHVIIFFSLKGH
jgi:hypothetical protein